METSSGDVRPIHESLNNLSSTELNDRLVSLSSLQCKLCDNLLSPPINLVDGLGNICGQCELEDKSRTTLRNIALEDVLQNLAIPCPNSSRGCKEHFAYFNILQHVVTCPNRSYSCPFEILANCTWKGGRSSVINHCYDRHTENILKSKDNLFYITTDIKSTHDLVSILNTGSDNFILHLKCDLESSSLYYTMYYMGNPDDIKNFSFYIEHIGKTNVNSCLLQYESSKIFPHENNFSLNVVAENALRIDLSLLEQLCFDLLIDTVLKIIPTNKVQFDETLLIAFECPICNNYMKPPIYQCLSGHSLCSNCRPKLGQCPTCRIGFGNTRNFSLEALSSKTKFPCLYRDLGCGVVMSAFELNKHEVECVVKPYACPFFEVRKCSWEGAYSCVNNHLSVQHSEKIRFTNFVELRLVLSYESTSDLFCLIDQGDIFRVCHKYDRGSHNVYWAVQYVGPKCDAHNYKYEIILSDSRNPNKMLIRTDLCQELTNYDNMFKQCVTLPSNLLAAFSTSDGITYSCKVTKTV